MDSIRALTEADLAAIAGGEDYYIGPNPIQDTLDQIGKNVSENTQAYFPTRPAIDHGALDATG